MLGCYITQIFPISNKPINLLFIIQRRKIYTRQTHAAGLMDGDIIPGQPAIAKVALPEPLRMQGAAICKSVKDSILAVNPGAKVIVMET
jgi:hypothetical protein